MYNALEYESRQVLFSFFISYRSEECLEFKTDSAKLAVSLGEHSDVPHIARYQIVAVVNWRCSTQRKVTGTHLSSSLIEGYGMSSICAEYIFCVQSI